MLVKKRRKAEQCKLFIMFKMSRYSQRSQLSLGVCWMETAFAADSVADLGCPWILRLW